MNPVLQGAGTQGSGQSRGTAASQCGGHPEAGSSPAPREAVLIPGAWEGLFERQRQGIPH